MICGVPSSPEFALECRRQVQLSQVRRIVHHALVFGHDGATGPMKLLQSQQVRVGRPNLRVYSILLRALIIQWRRIDQS